MISIATDKPVITLGDKIKISVYVKDQDGAPLDLSNVIRHYTGGVVVGTFFPGERVYQAETDYYGYFVAAGEETVIIDTQDVPSDQDDSLVFTDDTQDFEDAEVASGEYLELIDAEGDVVDQLRIQTVDIHALTLYSKTPDTDMTGWTYRVVNGDNIYLIDISGESAVGEELVGIDSGAGYTPDAQTTAQSDVTLLGFSDIAQEMVIDEYLTAVDAERGHFTTSVLETDAWPLGLYALRAIINQPTGADVLTENSRSDHLIVRS